MGLFKEARKYKKFSLKFLSVVSVIFLVTFALITTTQVNASTPKILSFQGRLTNATGDLLGSNGTNYFFKFAIYNSATGGTKLWPSGSPPSITSKVTQGVFNVLVGDTSIGFSTLDLDFDNSNYFLEVQVSSDNSSFETLSPRQQIVSSGFAINSETVHGGRFLNASGVGQFGGLATVSYSRFGTGTTTHNLTASSDLLITGVLETDSQAFFDSNASISGTFEGGTVKASTYTGDGALTIQSGGANTLNIDTGGAAGITIGGTNANALTLGRSGINTTLAGNIQAFTLAGTITGSGSPTITGIGQLNFSNASVSDRFELISSTARLGINAGNSTDTTLEVGGTASISGNITLTNSVTTGSAFQLQADSLTTGYGLNIRSTSLFAGGTASGSLFNLVDNSAVGIMNVASISANSLSRGTLIFAQANGLTTGFGLNLRSTGTITTGGALLNLVDNTMTAGTLASLSANAASFTGNVFNLQANGITTGNAMNISSTGAISGTGSLLKLTNSGATTGSLLSLVNNTMTAGTLASLSANATSFTGNVIQIKANGLTTGKLFSITASSSAGITGRIFDITAGITTGSVASISAKSMTSGSIFNITVAASLSNSTLARNGHILLVHDTLNNVVASWSTYGRLAIRASLKSRGIISACSGVNTGGNGCLDYAEAYPTQDASITAGDIVAIDPHNPVNIVKSTRTNAVIGVVSTNPGALIDGSAFMAGAETTTTPGHVPVALAGRVPVKVSLENGPINAGDYLTASSIPGVAMKAVKAGNVVGRAIEDYLVESSTSSILVFIEPGFYNGSDLEDLAPGISGDELAKTLISRWSGAPTPTDLSDIFTDRLAAAVEIITPKITTNGLTLDNISALKDAITFQSDTIFFGRPYFNTDTAGFATIKNGAAKVDVTFDREYLEQPIVNANITLNRASDSASLESLIFNSDIRYLVTNKTTTGFTIVLNKLAPADIQFSWIALAVKNAKTFESIDVTPTPSNSESAPVTSPLISETPVQSLASDSLETTTSSPAPTDEINSPSPTPETVLPSDTPISTETPIPSQ